MMTNEKLQQLAVELSGLNRETESERVRAIESAIVDYELGLLKENGGRAYFPLLKRFNGAIPYEAFYDILIDVLLPLLKKYDPAKKATFVTALAFTLGHRVKDYWEENKKNSNVALFGDLGGSSDDGEDIPFDIADETYAPDKAAEATSELEIFLMVATFVALRKAQEQHLSKSKRSYLEGFFTFDTTAQTKGGLFSEQEVVAENDTLFPIMELVVLEYLLEGQFASMRDVVKNTVKDEKRLVQRNETMQICYSLSKTTVVTKNKQYRKLFDAVTA
jgi:hypothetical protein